MFARTVRLTSCAAIALVTLCAGAAETCPEQVRVTFFDYDVAPIFNGAGVEFANPPGYLIEWSHKALAFTGCAATARVFTRRPVRRAYQELAHDETDIIANASVSTERLLQGVFPMWKGQVDTRMAYFQAPSSLWVRKDDVTIHWDGTTLRGPAGFKVGTPPGTPAETNARSQGWGTEPGGLGGSNVIDKLLAGRTSVALLSDVTVSALPETKKSLIRSLQPPVMQVYYYSLVNKRFYAKYPGFMAKYWQGLCRAARAQTELPVQKTLPSCR